MDITALLELKQTVKTIFFRYETYIRYAMRFLLGLVCIALINSRMGYNTKMAGLVVTLTLPLICAVLPVGFTAAICAGLILGHLYALSLEACAIAGVLFLCVYLLYYRFSTHDAIVILLTPVLFTFHIPSVMPFVLGLLFAPYSVVSMAFGVLIWFFLHNVAGNVSQYSNAQGGAEEHLSRVQDIAGSMAGDKTMLVYIAAFAVTALAIWILRRQSFRHAVYISIGAGAFLNLVILLVGDVMLDASVGIAGAFLGTLLGVAVAAAIMFFALHLDYSRTETVRFEDEEYYYFVKAVPKVVLREKQVRSKSINRSQSPPRHKGAHAQNQQHKNRTAHRAEGKESVRDTV